jgi:hypothetical protein
MDWQEHWYSLLEKVVAEYDETPEGIEEYKKRTDAMNVLLDSFEKGDRK